MRLQSLIEKLRQTLSQKKIDVWFTVVVPMSLWILLQVSMPMYVYIVYICVYTYVLICAVE